MTERVYRAAVESLFGILPDSHYTAIGRVAANSAALEALISSSIWRFGKMDDEPGACTTAQIYSADGKLKALISILRWRGITDRSMKKLNAFAGNLVGVMELRNCVVHDPWVGEFEKGAPNDPKPLRLQITAQKTLVFGYKPMSTDDVNHVAELLGDKIAEFDTLIREVMIELEEPPSESPG